MHPFIREGLAAYLVLVSAAPHNSLALLLCVDVLVAHSVVAHFLAESHGAPTRIVTRAPRLVSTQDPMVLYRRADPFRGNGRELEIRRRKLCRGFEIMLSLKMRDNLYLVTNSITLY